MDTQFTHGTKKGVSMVQFRHDQRSHLARIGFNLLPFNQYKFLDRIFISKLEDKLTERGAKGDLG